LNDSDQNEWIVSPIPPKHSLEIGDVLIVKVLSFDEETTNFFNVENNVNSANSSLTSANIYLNGFTINQEGIIEIPYIGEVYVLNQTINQAKESIEEKVNEYLKDATVICKLGNFNITVLGEIYRPNTYPIYKDNISIFEAVAISGGITDYGDLTKVKLIRTHNNKKTVHKIDLTQQSVINSDFYYLRNNDLLYVEPLRYRGLRKSQSQLLLSSLTTVAVLVNVYLKITE
jgi:polysaccharide export outer membrane protein